MTLEQLTQVFPHIDSVASLRRLAFLYDWRTAEDLGFPDFDVHTWTRRKIDAGYVKKRMVQIERDGPGRRSITEYRLLPKFRQRIKRLSK